MKRSLARLIRRAAWSLARLGNRLAPDDAAAEMRQRILGPAIDHDLVSGLTTEADEDHRANVAKATRSIADECEAMRQEIAAEYAECADSKRLRAALVQANRSTLHSVRGGRG